MVDLPVPEVVEVDPMLQILTQPFVDDTRMKDLIPVLDLLRHRQECLLDIRRVLRGCLKDGYRQLVRKFLHVYFVSRAITGPYYLSTYLCRFELNHFPLNKVCLVANNKLVDTFCSITVYFGQPSLDVHVRI